MPRASAALHSLADLGAGWAAKGRVRAPREAPGAARREAQRRRDEPDAHELFVRSVGPVQPLRHAGRAEIVRAHPAPHPRQRELDERRAARAAMSDEVTPESLLLTDDALSFRRRGVGADVVARLRRGHWALQAQIDLHGCTRDEARVQLASFLRVSSRRGLRCLRVVHGKGNGSPGREPVLKLEVRRWLAQAAEVVAYTQASAAQGGAGALLVLLAPAAR